MANVNEIDIYSDTIDTIEEMIDNDNVFPIVQDSKVKLFLKMILEFIKFIINYLKNSIDGAKKGEPKGE